MDTMNFYNFKVHKDVYFLLTSITNYNYDELYFDIIGKMSIDEFKKYFSNLMSEMRDKIELLDRKHEKEIATYVILSYRDRVCSFSELQEKVCNISKNRFLEVFDLMVEDLKTKIY